MRASLDKKERVNESETHDDGCAGSCAGGAMMRGERFWLGAAARRLCWPV